MFVLYFSAEEARVRPTPAATTSTTTFMPNVEENNVIYPFYTHPPSHKPASGGRQDYLDRPDRLGRLDRLGHHRGSDIGDRDRGFPVRRTHHGHHHNSHGGGSSHEASSTVDYWPHIPHAPGQGQFAGGYPSSPRKPDWPHKRPHFKNPDRPVSDDTAVFKKPLNSLERGRAWERAGKKEGLTNSSNSLHQKSSFIGRLLTLVSTSLLMLVIRMMMQRWSVWEFLPAKSGQMDILLRNTVDRKETLKSIEYPERYDYKLSHIFKRKEDTVEERWNTERIENALCTIITIIII